MKITFDIYEGEGEFLFYNIFLLIYVVWLTTFRVVLFRDYKNEFFLPKTISSHKDLFLFFLFPIPLDEFEYFSVHVRPFPSLVVLPIRTLDTSLICLDPMSRRMYETLESPDGVKRLSIKGVDILPLLPLWI